MGETHVALRHEPDPIHVRYVAFIANHRARVPTFMLDDEARVRSDQDFAAAAAWLGLRSWIGDSEALTETRSVELTAERDEALREIEADLKREQRVDIRRRRPTRTIDDARVDANEVHARAIERVRRAIDPVRAELRALGRVTVLDGSLSAAQVAACRVLGTESLVARGRPKVGRPSTTLCRDEWIRFLVDDGAFASTDVEQLLRTAPSNWTPAPFEAIYAAPTDIIKSALARGRARFRKINMAKSIEDRKRAARLAERQRIDESLRERGGVDVE